MERLSDGGGKEASKTDYSILGAYCPNALLSTMGKVLSACFTEDIAHMSEVICLLCEATISSLFQNKINK